MAQTRLVIHTASPQYSINSTCYVAQVKYNVGPEVLQVVFKEDGTETPTSQGDVIKQIQAHPDVIEGVYNTSIDALKVKPSDGLVVLDKTKFEIAPFLQQESHVKCQPLAGGEPGKAIGCDS